MPTRPLAGAAVLSVALAAGAAPAPAPPPAAPPAAPAAPATGAPAAAAPGAGAPAAAAPAQASTGGGPDASDNAVRRVVAISVDGLASTAVRELGRSGTPALHRMIRQGASTLNARTLRESTSTLPNHTGMLTGRRVLVSAGGHGVDFNTDDGRTVHRSAGEYVDSVFSVVHDRGGSTVLYSGKDKFAFLDRSWNGRFGARDAIGTSQGADKIDRYVYTRNAGALVTGLVRRLRRHPATFSLLHLRLPDSAGHEHGYLSPRYYDAVRRTDTLVGRVLTAVNARRSLRRHTVVLLTADHGGHGGAGSHSHRDPRRLGHYRIPFLVWGTSVARGADLYGLNPDRRRPGDRRTTYAGRQPVRNAEVANLTADLLDLPAVPGSQLNRRLGLDVHR